MSRERLSVAFSGDGSGRIFDRLEDEFGEGWRTSPERWLLGYNDDAPDRVCWVRREAILWVEPYQTSEPRLDD